MNTLTRRSAIATSASVASWAVAPSRSPAGQAPAAEVAAAVTAPEDLMREHGVLNRLMLVYEAALAPPASARRSSSVSIEAGSSAHWQVRVQLGATLSD